MGKSQNLAIVHARRILLFCSIEKKMRNLPTYLIALALLLCSTALRAADHRPVGKITFEVTDPGARTAGLRHRNPEGR